jgi:hypothetical protein
MTTLGFFACGPSIGLLLILGGAAAGALVLTISFIVGFICLFTSKRKLGVWLTSIPGLLLALIYFWLQGQGS